MRYDRGTIFDGAWMALVMAVILASIFGSVADWLMEWRYGTLIAATEYAWVGTTVGVVGGVLGGLIGWLLGVHLYQKSVSPPPGSCKKCGYDLTGNVSGRCPECGAEFR